MTLWMNATFLKVLKEVLLGLPLTKPNVKRGDRIRRGFRPGVDLHLGAISQSIQEREKEKTQSQPNIGIKCYVCMKYA